MNQESYTPMIQQYLEIKKDYADAIVFFRLGDFYEMFFEDAVLASRILEIALTGKDAGIERVAMCGIPYHAYESYAQKLVNKGYKVAIVEQVEDPKVATGIVKREVVKIITPGVQVELTTLTKDNNYLASIYNFKKMFIIAYSDVSTGATYLTLEGTFKRTLEVLRDLNVKEVVVKETFPEIYLNEIKTSHIVVSYMNNTTIPEFLLNTVTKIEASYYPAIGMLYNYALNTEKVNLKHFKEVEFYTNKDYLKLDYFTKRNLELLETMRYQDASESLFGLIDKTVTAMGSRMLKTFLMRPLVDENKINKRLDLTETFINDYLLRNDLINELKGVYDLERIISRISCNSANAKDLVFLRRTLGLIPNIKDILKNSSNELLQEYDNSLDSHQELFNLLESSLVENPPFTIKEGGMIKHGYNEELDKYQDIKEHSKEWLSNLEIKEKERLNVKNLKIGYNKVFGYYIEISKGQSLQLGDIEGYERRQTLANSERYISKELKEFETILLSANDKIEALEYDIFNNIKNKVQEYIPSLQLLATNLAYLDAILSLAVISDKYGYVRPTFNNSEITIVDGRHPVLEELLKEKYVSNDLYINSDYNMLLITGPNMSGKSTYMRMVALISILAQIGSFVPAKKAKLKIFDQIFTRIGASDDLSSGQSTFMVEMSEANYAIKNATKNSLILFDEIGRGTATYDGMALAEAILEYIHEKVKATTLFSTHYHELTVLDKTLKHLKNVHVEAINENGNITFIHKVKDGPTDKSYGINVAELVGMPKVLINRASLILEELEKDKTRLTPSLFDFDEEIKEDKKNPVIEYLSSLDIDELSPKEALNKLYEMKEKFGDYNEN